MEKELPVKIWSILLLEKPTLKSLKDLFFKKEKTDSSKKTNNFQEGSVIIKALFGCCVFCIFVCVDRIVW